MVQPQHDWFDPPPAKGFFFVVSLTVVLFFMWLTFADHPPKPPDPPPTIIDVMDACDRMCRPRVVRRWTAAPPEVCECGDQTR